MSEILFLAIAGSAAAFKVIAIVIGITWAFRSLLAERAAPLKYRYSRATLPYRPWNAG